MDFRRAFDRLIDHEGGFQNDPRDRGNWTGGAVGVGECRGTKYGISAAAYPHEDIAGLTLERAGDLYRRDYWRPAGCDVLPDLLRFDVFDAAVNSGVRAAIKLLQRAVGVTADGEFGPRTLRATQDMRPEALFVLFNVERLRWLSGLSADKWVAFGRGLVRRVAWNLAAFPAGLPAATG